MTATKDDIDRLVDELIESVPGSGGYSTDGYTEFPDIDYDRPSAAELKRQRRQWRASITEAALVTAEDAAELLPGRATTVRRWLERVPRYRLPNGQEVYRWGDILQALERVA